MRTHILVLLLAASTAPAQEPFRWQGRIPAGREIEIKGVTGSVRAVAATGNEVQVTATKRAGRQGNAEDVRIQVVQHDEGVTICAVYPGRERNNECGAGGWRDLNVQNNDTRVEWEVRVPAGVRFVGRTVNGDVVASALRSEVDAHTVSGSVRVSTTGNVDAQTVSGDVEISTRGFGQAQTVSGDITASLGQANWTEALEFRTVSGDISLTLPAAANAQVRVQSMNGEIESDFPLTMEGRRMRSRANATLGRGGRELYLQTLSGDIELRRAR